MKATFDLSGVRGNAATSGGEMTQRRWKVYRLPYSCLVDALRVFAADPYVSAAKLFAEVPADAELVYVNDCPDDYCLWLTIASASFPHVESGDLLPLVAAERNPDAEEQ